MSNGYTNPYTTPETPAAGIAAPAQGNANGGVTPVVLDALGKTRPWVLFVGIVWMIMSVIVLFLGFSALGGGDVYDDSMPTVSTDFLGIYYIVIAIVMFFPSLFLLKFSGSIKRLRRTQEVLHLENAAADQRKFWVYMGIVGIIYVIFIVIGILAAVGAASSGY